MSGLTRLNPPSIAKPVGTYSHGVVAPAAGEWLYIAGQVGIHPDGSTPQGIAAQTEAAWSNLVAILAQAGMDVDCLVKVTTFMTRADDITAMAGVRSRFLGDARPASTLLIIQALARAEWLVEVEAVAFRSTAASAASASASAASASAA